MRGWIMVLRPDLIIHGGAKGADSVAHEIAHELGIRTRVSVPDYALHGPAAPHVRNDRMLSECDFVLAFWDGKSPGTKSVIDKARRRKIPHKVITP